MFDLFHRGENTASIRATVIGGGTGAPKSIRALLDMGVHVSAVVAMADDGGSTGILRERAGAIPPGDIRKCLVAMAADPNAPLARAFQYRFDYAQNHALGNLILTALSDSCAGFPEAIAICEDLLDTRGHVYPSTLASVTLHGRTRDGRRIEGQAHISKSDCALARVFLQPSDPQPYAKALEAIRESDLIVLGPGSLFTSIIPNLLVPGVVEAIRDSEARTVFVCSLADMQGETWGLNCAEHVEALLDHGMKDLLDVALIHCDKPDAPNIGMVTQRFAPITGVDVSRSLNQEPVRGGIRRTAVNPVLLDRIRSQGVRVIVDDFADTIHPTWHDVAKLKAVLEEVLATCPSRRR